MANFQRGTEGYAFCYFGVFGPLGMVSPGCALGMAFD